MTCEVCSITFLSTGTNLISPSLRKIRGITAIHPSLPCGFLQLLSLIEGNLTLTWEVERNPYESLHNMNLGKPSPINNHTYRTKLTMPKGHALDDRLKSSFSVTNVRLTGISPWLILVRLECKIYSFVLIVHGNFEMLLRKSSEKCRILKVRN